MFLGPSSSISKKNRHISPNGVWCGMIGRLLSIALSCFALHGALASYHERRLYEDLMRDYNNLERPVANHSNPVTVYLKVIFPSDTFQRLI